MNKRLGITFALLAAFVNGSVGAFANLTADTGLSDPAVAFFKCLIAMLIVMPMLVLEENVRQFLRRKLFSATYIAAGFFGVFVMNTFEIRAYSHQSVATTVLMFLVGATVTTQLLSRFFFRQLFTTGRVLAIMLSISGAYLLLSHEVDATGIQGCLLGMLAGGGYGTYLVIAQRADIKASMITIFAMTFWGTIFLLPGYLADGASVPAAEAWSYLLGLALVPTILGYYFTTLAVNFSKASDVQIYELSEPLFAAGLAWMVLGQHVTPIQYAGGALVVLAIVFNERFDTILGLARKQA
jgi:drug/metabolite transporter (DMT)-like permease